MLSKDQLKIVNDFFANGETELREDGRQHFVRTKKREEVRTILFEEVYTGNGFNYMTKKQLSNNKYKLTKKVGTFGIIRAYVEKHDKVLYI